MNPVEVPIGLQVNLNPMVGQIGPEQFPFMGVWLVLGFVVVCSILVWKILHKERRSQIEPQAGDAREFDRAA